jgi:acetylglutamate kinase
VSLITDGPDVRQRTRAKARVLLEALPFIREHAGRTVVVKVGGAAMDTAKIAESFAQDVALLRLVGIRPVIVHGGGPQVSDMSRRLGIEPSFVDGHRVTDERTLEVARMVLVGIVNQDLVASLERHGTTAIGLSGIDGGLLRVSPLDPALGAVGRIDAVGVETLEHVMDRAVPVVASIGSGVDGRPFNVNADLVAGAIAGAMGAAKLVYLSDVSGLIDRGGQLITEVTGAGCRDLIASGAVTGGMLPKLSSALEAMAAGVERVHLLDGRVEHGLILELFTPEGIGTMMVGGAA